MTENWIEKLAKSAIPFTSQESGAPGWRLLTEKGSGAQLLRTEEGCYRIVDWEPLGWGFSRGLLGASYAQGLLQRSRPGPLLRLLQKESEKGRYHVLAFRFRDEVSTSRPLLTLFEDSLGNHHLAETSFEQASEQASWPAFGLLTLIAHLMARRADDPTRFDAFGDFLPPGAACTVQRHGTERLKKHIPKRVLYDADLCTQCLRCATLCSEMRAVVGERGARLLGPMEDYCTNCGLCQKRCSYLTAVPKEACPELLKEKDRASAERPSIITENGVGVYFYGPAAEAYMKGLQSFDEDRAPRLPYEVSYESLFPVFDSSGRREECKQTGLRLSGVEGMEDWPPLLTTGTGQGGREALLCVRSHYRAALVFQTSDGRIEREMAEAALEVGLDVIGVAGNDGDGFASPVNETTKELHGTGRWRQGPLLHLWEKGEVDLILAPFSQRLPAELQQRVMERTGGLAVIVSPQIPQAMTVTRSPAMAQLNAAFLEIFKKYHELMDEEARVARELLKDVPRHAAFLHARYRSMAIASGHSACPTCAEAQVLAIPVYMGIAMSLARGEVPQVAFTCETGCMSETLVKVNEVAQKVPGGRTVFGGGFAYGEAIAIAQDWGVRMGHLKKGRRYVVSQGGDGGSVIGLPAWLNALRQQAFLVRQRYSNVLHFITITDTQVYSNTGGEGSASSLLGMSTLTTPIGKYLLGNQKVQWTLINLAAEFPGVLVGMGHSGNRTAIQQFWQRADELGQSAIRWDVTPCPETGKFFGEDPDDLAEVMAHAGMLPEVVFVGRFRKRVAPFHPDDRDKAPREWRRRPKPIEYWLHRDPRYRSLFRKDPRTGKEEPANLTAQFLVEQLEAYRDQLNWQIDLETHLVRQAEEWVQTLFVELREAWARFYHQPERFPYALLFNREGELKPEYAGSLEEEMVRRILGWNELNRYAAARDEAEDKRGRLLESFLEQLEELDRSSQELAETVSGRREAGREIVERIQVFKESLADEALKLQDLAVENIELSRVEEELFASDDQPAEGLSRTRHRSLYTLLDRILEERAMARQTELQQFRLAMKLKEDFLHQGGLIRGTEPAAVSQAEREAIRRQVARMGPFAIGVASLAGDRGIAINRIFARFFTAKGAWAGMSWQFGSSKRGTPVLSATFVDSKPLQRKDAMHTFPVAVLVVTNFEEMKRRPDLFFERLHPRGFLIINHREPAEMLWRELVGGYSESLQKVVFDLRRRMAEGKPGSREAGKRESEPSSREASQPSPPDLDTIREAVAQALYEKPRNLLSPDQERTAEKATAMICASVISVDMEGIMQSVTGSANVVSNLVAVGPIFHALQELGFALDWERDLSVLTEGFPGAVLKNEHLLRQYYRAMEEARSRVAACGMRDLACGPGDAADSPDTKGGVPSLSDPADHLMIMGGVLAGMVLTQIAIPEHPLFYVGFPITPAGNPFYAMAEAFADGHPYIVVDELNPSEKVAAEKLLGIARTGGFLPVTFTASQGWRLFTEIIPQFAGARLEGIFVITRRALAAPNLNIEESHTDFMSFRDDGGLMLAPKSIQEYIPSLYLARLLTHYAKLPVILSIGGITDTHKIGLVKVPSDERVRPWLREKLKGVDFLEQKLINRQGSFIVHGPSGTSDVYQETQSELEKAHKALARIYPYAVEAVHELTGVWLDELETAVAGGGWESRKPGSLEARSREARREEVSASRPSTVFILQGSLYPNAVEALQELESEGWTDMACISVRTFNPFPEDKLSPWLEKAERVTVLDRSNSFGSIPPLASRVYAAYARLKARKAGSREGREAAQPSSLRASQSARLRTLVGGLGGREITVEEMKEILLSSHLLFHPAEPWESALIEGWVEEDAFLKALLEDAAALELRSTDRNTRAPSHVRGSEDQHREYTEHFKKLGDWLKEKDYGTFLANYHQVEFVRPKEVLQETSLLQQIVLYLEIRLAQEALSGGRGTARHALVLLHYSQDESHRDAAKGLLLEEVRKGVLPASLALSYGISVDAAPNLRALEGGALGDREAGRTEASENTPSILGSFEPSMSAPDSKSGGTPLSVPEPEQDPDEAQRIRTVLKELVTLQGERPLFYNPEDYEFELLEQLRARYPDSQLNALEGPCPEDRRDQLVWKYRCRYRDVIDDTLQREVLIQHHAPELREIFEGEGRKRLELLSKKFREHSGEGEGEPASEAIRDELERWLAERCLPHYPKKPAFYLDYFRNWIMPEMERSS